MYTCQVYREEMDKKDKDNHNNIGKDRLTPEEKLLKIIEDPASVVGRRKFFQSKNQPKKKKLPDPKILMSKIKGFRINKASLKRFDLPLANKIAIVICSMFTIFLFLSFIKDSIGFKKHFTKLIAEASVVSTKDENLPNLDVKEADLLQEARRRNMFSFLPPETKTEVFTTEVPTVITNFKLVGILWSDNPQAMIEDTKEQKTFLVNTGDEISQLKIKRIFRDKVILGKDEREWELR